MGIKCDFIHILGKGVLIIISLICEFRNTVTDRLQQDRGDDGWIRKSYSFYHKTTIMFINP